MPTINFKTKLFKIGPSTILKLPREASLKLPSRGMSMVEGTINGADFQAPLEPDGRGSHWFRVDQSLQKKAKAAAKDTVTLAVEPMKEWTEPKLPTDLQKALTADSRGQEIWLDITTKARWDWIRWVGATSNLDTRKIRIVKTLSKMKGGTRSPCCFNRSMCCDPTVSKNGQLIEPTET